MHSASDYNATPTVIARTPRRSGEMACENPTPPSLRGVPDEAARWLAKTQPHRHCEESPTKRARWLAKTQPHRHCEESPTKRRDGLRKPNPTVIARSPRRSGEMACENPTPPSLRGVPDEAARWLAKTQPHRHCEESPTKRRDGLRKPNPTVIARSPRRSGEMACENPTPPSLRGVPDEAARWLAKTQPHRHCEESPTKRRDGLRKPNPTVIARSPRRSGEMACENPTPPSLRGVPDEAARWLAKTNPTVIARSPDEAARWLAKTQPHRHCEESPTKQSRPHRSASSGIASSKTPRNDGDAAICTHSFFPAPWRPFTLSHQTPAPPPTHQPAATPHAPRLHPPPRAPPPHQPAPPLRRTAQ